MKDLQLFIDESTRMVDESLDKLIPSADTEPQLLHEAIRWSLFAGGKRFRPALLFAVGQIFDASSSEMVRTASAVEMIHTYSLIHDDLPSMDNDDLRRGRETCHKKYGEATAILAGDVLETLAFQAVAEDDSLTAGMRISLVAELARAAGTPFGMVAGQHLDLEAEGKEISIDAIDKIHSFKTGALIAACGKAGVIIGGGTKTDMDAISNYASRLGLLFQITDDLLDVTQTTELLGKTARKDIAANKATYPSIYGIEETAERAKVLFAQTIACLDPIDRPVKILVDIARMILERQS